MTIQELQELYDLLKKELNDAKAIRDTSIKTLKVANQAIVNIESKLHEVDDQFATAESKNKKKFYLSDLYKRRKKDGTFYTGVYALVRIGLNIYMYNVTAAAKWKNNIDKYKADVCDKRKQPYICYSDMNELTKGNADNYFTMEEYEVIEHDAPRVDCPEPNESVLSEDNTIQYAVKASVYNHINLSDEGFIFPKYNYGANGADFGIIRFDNIYKLYTVGEKVIIEFDTNQKAQIVTINIDEAVSLVHKLDTIVKEHRNSIGAHFTYF